MKSLSFEIYFLHQFPNGHPVPVTDAIGLQFNLVFRIGTIKYPVEPPIRLHL